MEDVNPYASPAPESVLRGGAPTLSPPQAVEYRLEAEDIHAAAAHMWSHSATMSHLVARRKRSVLVAALASLVLGGLLLADGKFWFLGLGMLGASVALTVQATRSRALMIKNTRAFNDRMIKEEGAYLLDRWTRLTVEQEGIRCEDIEGYWFRKWSSFQRVAKTPTHLVVYVNPSYAFAVPGRAFIDEERFEGFADLAVRLWEAARPAAAEPVSSTGR